MLEFSTLGRAFMTLLRLLAGSGQVYRTLSAHSPSLGPLYLVVFWLLFTAIVTPLFLAILNDAYALRDEQRQVRRAEAAAEAKREAEAAAEAKREAARAQTSTRRLAGLRKGGRS